MDELDQYRRRNTLEIHGVPETTGEVTIIKSVDAALDFPI